MPYHVYDKIISPNIWDEQWELATIATGTGVVSSGSKLVSKNFIPCLPNTTYYKCGTTAYGWCLFFYYDKNKNFISNDNNWTNDGTFTTPNNAYFMKFMSYSNATTYNHDICINVSNPTINGHYYPYNMGGKPYVIKDNNNSMNIGG